MLLLVRGITQGSCDTALDEVLNKVLVPNHLHDQSVQNAQDLVML